MTPEAYCFHKTFEPAPRAPFTFDRHYLLYALKGTLRLEAGGHRWMLPPARAAFIAAGESVSIAMLTKLTSASVLFSPDAFDAPATPVAVFDVSPLARELIGECRAYGADSGELDAYARSLFTTLAAVVGKLARTPSPLVLPVPKSASLMRAVDYTEAKASGEITFTDVARETGQSPRALARRFAVEMGMTWQQALRRIRIMRAVEALAGSSLAVSEIALASGYNSLSAFNSAFTGLMGASPTDYRRSFRA